MVRLRSPCIRVFSRQGEMQTGVRWVYYPLLTLLKKILYTRITCASFFPLSEAKYFLPRLTTNPCEIRLSTRVRKRESTVNKRSSSVSVCLFFLSNDERIAEVGAVPGIHALKDNHDTHADNNIYISTDETGWDKIPRNAAVINNIKPSK